MEAKATKVYDMCSFVGLEENVARYILRQNENQTNEYWIKKEEILQDNQIVQATYNELKNVSIIYCIIFKIRMNE